MRSLQVQSLFMLTVLCVGCATSLMVGGSVASVDPSNKTLMVTTPMGDKEIIRIDDATRINREGEVRYLTDLKYGDNVKIDYVKQRDGGVVAREIAIGYSVPHCTCGQGCACPISRGCRVIRY